MSDDQAGGGAFTVKEFCAAHSMSVAFYYVLKAKGEGPREMRLNSKVLISWEAAEAWRRQHEDAVAPTNLAPATGGEIDDVPAPDGAKVD
jgi:hypothetical protein